MNNNKTYRVFYIRETKRRITGMDEVEAESGQAAIDAVRDRAEHQLTITNVVVRKRGYWEQEPCPSET